MRHLARLSCCSLAVSLTLAVGSGCFPDADKIRNQASILQPDAATNLSTDVLAPVQPDSLPALDAALDAGLDRPPSDVPRSIPDTGPAILDTRVPDLAPDRATPDAPADSPKIDSAPPSTNLPARCKTYAENLCKTYSSCAPAGFISHYETQSVCISRIEMGCNIWGALPGVTWPTDKCASGWAGLSCKDFLNGTEPEDCYAPGLRPQGAECDSNYQCQGRQCIWYGGSKCGICNERSPAGGSCISDGSCKRGLVCAKKICVAPGMVDASCDEAHPCAASLICTSAGKCIEKLPEGATCDVNSPIQQCDWRVTSLQCSPISGKCRKGSPSTFSCGWNRESDTLSYCSGSRLCSNSVCRPVPEVGAACDEDKGADCLYPAYCDSTSATCLLPADMTCGG